MKTSPKEIGLIAAMVVGVLAVWIHGEIKVARTATPGEHEKNLIGYLQSRPAPTRIIKLSRDGNLYFVVTGQHARAVFAIPSGPPVYVFDETGQIVGWCQDSGDGNRFIENWREIEGTVAISAEEAMRIVRSHQPQPAKAPQQNTDNHEMP